MTEAFGSSALEAIEEQVKRNTEMFERAMKMFMPFGIGATAPTQDATTAAGPKSAQRAAPSASDLDEMRRQLSEMQAKINALTDK
jgi:polyhydroxyalkanoate synthesis regulator protein